MKTVLFLLAMTLVPTAHAAKQVKAQVFKVSVTENGFEPSSISAKSGRDVVLKITRKTDSTCAKEVKISERKIEKKLPLNKTVSIGLGKLNKGEVRFSCGMDMISGVISAD